MVTKSKAVEVKMGWKAHGNIHGFETNNGMTTCIQADTTLHVVNYMDYSLVSRRPLPMGLHCWAPLRSGAEGPKKLPVVATVVTPCIQPGDALGSKEPTT